MIIEIFIAIILLILIIVAAFDVFWPFTVLLVLLAIGAWWREGLTIFWILWKPEIIGLYIIIGFVWVFFKWTRLVEKYIKRGAKEPPLWSQHSYDFAAYFFYWPIDAAAYVLSDLIQEIWRFISTIIERSFDRYAEWRFRSITKKEKRNDRNN